MPHLLASCLSSDDRRACRCLEDENSWLQQVEPEDINRWLAERRSRFDASLASGQFWTCSKEERERLAPEVHRVAWLDLHVAAEGMLHTLSNELIPLDGWQGAEFERLGITRRDPMFQTLATLLEVEACAAADDVRAVAAGASQAKLLTGVIRRMR